jgi:hypothetical protein
MRAADTLTTAAAVRAALPTLSGRNVDFDLMARVLGEGDRGHRINQQKGAAA